MAYLLSIHSIVRQLVTVARRAFLALILVFGSCAALGQVVLQPGDFKNDFVFYQTTLDSSLTALELNPPVGPTIPARNLNNPGPYGATGVAFSDLGSTPTIRLDAFAYNWTPVLGLERQIEAYARGKLAVNFCVAATGQTNCGIEDGQTVAATIKYKICRLGKLTTFLPGSVAAVSVSVRVYDVTAGRAIYVDSIENTSIGNLFGKFKVVAKVPFPVPEIADATLAEVETFVVQLRRGREYRYEIIAAAKATAGRLPNPNPTRPFARCNFNNDFQEYGGKNLNGAQLVEFSIDVSTAAATETEQLRAALASLQESVSKLASQLETINAEVEKRLSELENNLANHTHTYRTGPGVGHNSVEATTTPASDP